MVFQCSKERGAKGGVECDRAKDYWRVESNWRAQPGGHRTVGGQLGASRSGWGGNDSLCHGGERGLPSIPSTSNLSPCEMILRTEAGPHTHTEIEMHTNAHKLDVGKTRHNRRKNKGGN